MKIAINRDYGKFSLSKEAYCELGLPWDGYGYAYSDHNRRTDPKLIEVIERLGAKASGPLAYVCIIEIPDGTHWQIENYDGVEWVTEVHSTWP